MIVDLPISQIARGDLLDCPPDMPVRQAAARMSEACCSSILVIEAGQVVGIWTERDALAMNFSDTAAQDHPISRVMSAPVKTIAHTATIGEAALRFKRENVRHLLVVDEAGAPYGLVTQTDVVRNQGVEVLVRLREVRSATRRIPPMVPGDLRASEAILKMHQAGLDALVVEGRQGLGILTERDVVRLIGSRSLDLRVEEVASFPLVTVTEDSSLYLARRQFVEKNIRHLGVTDAGGALTSLITYADILADIEQDYVQELQQALKEQNRKFLDAQRVLEENARRFEHQTGVMEAILDVLPVSVFIKDEEGKFVLFNQTCASLVGVRRETVAGKTDFDFFSEATAQRLRRHDEEVRASGHLIVREERLQMQGNDRVMLTYKRFVPVGEQRLLVGVAVDISEQKRAERLLIGEKRILEMIASDSSLPEVLENLCRNIELELDDGLCSVLLLDDDGVHLRHGAAPSLPEEYNRQSDGVVIGPRTGSCGTAAYTGKPVVVEDIASDPLWESGREAARKAGLAACWSSPIYSSGRQVKGTFAVYYREPHRPQPFEYDVINRATHLAAISIARAETEAALHHLATQDSLTNLINRRRLLELGEAELQRARRFQHSVAVLMLDVDYFKQVNDTHGHAAGDLALQRIAAICVQELRGIDLCGRMGGEEFAAILPETDGEGARQAAERMRLAIESTPLQLDDGVSLHMTISVGVSLLNDADQNIYGVLARADDALYLAKRNGRNRVVCAS